MRLAVLIPVYNERDLIARAVQRLDHTPPPTLPDGTPLERRLIIVDDGSTDGTRDALESLRGRADVIIHHHPRNAGKGAAIRTALKAALDDGADLVLVHDADLEYDPRDHPALLAPILDDRADAVIGSRFLGSTHRVLYFWHAVANRFITLLSNVFTNLNLTDIECCLKAFSRPVAERLVLRENRFGVEPEIVARLARMRLVETHTPRRVRVFEVAVSYAGRTYADGKKIRWTDGLSALRCILRYNILP
ncbi:MAG: glycosyltransferase family 2 protein [Phycisphaeraceae bacterium]|nr:MAG: glycosyltransferase family 2 protein [Phycisphaeraceae bacterium]